jgi:hypothetical protein
MTHHFILTDNIATGATYVLEYDATDLAQAFGPDLRDLLARGQTVRIGDRLVCDMQAFITVHRQLPDAMTRPPLSASAPASAPANLAARRAGVPQLKRV